MSFFNLEPLTLAEIRQSGNSIDCPACGKPRWVMWKTLTASYPIPLVPMTLYCRCPAKTMPQKEEKP